MILHGLRARLDHVAVCDCKFLLMTKTFWQTKRPLQLSASQKVHALCCETLAAVRSDKLLSKLPLSKKSLFGLQTQIKILIQIGPRKPQLSGEPRAASDRQFEIIFEFQTPSQLNYSNTLRGVLMSDLEFRRQSEDLRASSKNLLLVQKF